MKNKFLLLTIFFVSNSICSETDLYKWIYAGSMPLVFGHLAVQANVEAARQSKDLKPNDELKIVDAEKEKPELNLKKSDTKPDDNGFKAADSSKKSVTSQYLKTMYLTFLTYGALINLANRIYEKSPGDWIEITIKPFANAALISYANYVMNKKISHDVFFS